MNMSRRFGCLPDLPDHNDYPTGLRAMRLPAEVDLRPWCPPIMDQGQLGSCTAHGVTAAARWHIIKRGTTYDFDASRLGVYWRTRQIEGTILSDVGAQIRNAIKSVVTFGMGHEELWPYDPNRFADQPPQDLDDDATQYKALVYSRVDVNAGALKVALAAGHPVVIGISVYPSFEGPEVATTGVVPMPARGESLTGGHCMLVVGYGQRPGYFTVQNSWGEYWGDKGFCYLPEQYLGSRDYGSDYWIISTFGSEAEKAAGTA